MIGNYGKTFLNWNEALKEQCYESLTVNSGSLFQLVFADIDKTQDGIDSYVESFTSSLMENCPFPKQS